jgi:hypothetical protein
MKNKTISIDYEYNDRRLVCCCTLDSDENEPRTWWLADDSQTEPLKRYIEEHKEDRVFICHALEKAEGHSFWRMGLDPRQYRWYDTYTVEKIRVIASNVDISKAEKKMFYGLGLVDLERRYLGLEDRSEHKEAMRELIVADKNLEENKQAILDYCSEDIDHLRKIADLQIRDYTDLSRSSFTHVIRLVRDLPMVVKPIDWEEVFINLCYTPASYSRCYYQGVNMDYRVRKAYQQKDQILDMFRESFNQSHREVFVKDKKGKYHESQKALQELIAQSEQEIQSKDQDFVWPRSAKGLYEASSSALEDDIRVKRLPWVSDYRKYKDMASTMNRLKNIEGLDDPGQPLKVYPTHGPFGTQTGRAAPKTSEGFVWGWGHIWRVQVNPRDPDHVLVAVDYSAEENAIIGAVSDDPKYQECYLAKDFYIKTGQFFGLIDDPNATKKSHPEERETVKILMLMKGYGAGDKLIAMHLDKPLKEAKALSKKFEATFTKFSEFKNKLVDLTDNSTKQCTILLLPDNMPFVFWNLEDNFIPSNFKPIMERWGLMRRRRNKFKKTTSLTNLPIQGGGSSVLRRIIKKSDEAGLDYIATIHDEVVYNIPKATLEEDVTKIKGIFKEAFEHFYGEKPIKVGEPEMREYDGKIYSHEAGDNELWKKLIHLGLYGEDEIELA